MRLSRIVIPVLLGLAGVGYLFYRQFDLEQFRAIDWTAHAFLWIGAALLLLVVRHFLYAYRLRSITGKFFSWRKYLELIVLWEFSAALTPTSKGGPFVMLFALTQEKLPAGRTAAAVFYTMVCDAGFFVLLMPFLLGFYGPVVLSPGLTSYEGFASGTFFVTYAMMATYWCLLVFALLVRPQLARQGLYWLSKRTILKKWSDKIRRMGDEFMLAAEEIRTQDFRYHARVILATIGAWTTKFLLINCLIIAIVPSTPIDGSTQAFLYGRLVAMFVIMSFSPTPGGAGLAEVALGKFISDFVPQGIALVVALLWRGMAYYGYLLLGAIIVPAWIAGRLRSSHQTGKTAHPETPKTPVDAPYSQFHKVDQD